MTHSEMLVPIAQTEIDGTLVQSVNARDLHEFLGVGKDFSTWLKDRIQQYNFLENADFVVFPEAGGNPQGGRPSKEYAISIDMAKELSMVERNEKGKQARKYFIEMERRAREAATVNLNSPSQLRGLLANYAERTEIAEAEVQRLASENEGLQEDSEALTKIAKADGSLTITDAAKTLQMQPKALFQFLDQNGWTYRRHGNKERIAYQAKLQSGLLEHKCTTVERSDGSERVITQTRITPKGMARLAKLLPPLARVA